MGRATAAYPRVVAPHFTSPGLHPQIAHPSEFLLVAGDQGCIRRQRDGGDHHVICSDQSSRLLQLCADDPEALCGHVVKRKRSQFRKKAAQCRKIWGHVLAVPGAVQQFCFHHAANGHLA